ncbi:MAG: ribosomal large subunit pseudouridine synthase B [Clostridia bacterium]|nr:ribosomal large subunit pseudouridine synthase B [Clostridia bacterium]
MNYETAFINRNFLLKVYGTGENGERINRLVGVSGLIGLIGVELANKFINRALNSGKDSTKCKLRRGLQVTLYYK